MKLCGWAGWLNCDDWLESLEWDDLVEDAAEETVEDAADAMPEAEVGVAEDEEESGELLPELLTGRLSDALSEGAGEVRLGNCLPRPSLRHMLSQRLHQWLQLGQQGLGLG